MRVWQYTGLDVTGIGGVETHIAEISGVLRELGHEVHIGRQIPNAWFKGHSSQRFVIHTHGDCWPNMRLLSLLRETGSWIHVCHGTSVGRVLACREYFSLSGWKGSIRDFLPTRFADATVAVSETALSEARRYFRMRIPARVIANGASLRVFEPLEAVSSSSRLIFLGRGSDRVKNTSTLLTACEAVARRHPSFELWAAPGIEARAPFLQNIGEKRAFDLAATLTQCRALVLCSLYEGDPIVLHEAKAMGLPVIVSDLPQLREALSGYDNAEFIDPRNPESLTRGIEKVLFETGEIEPSPMVRDWSQVAKEFLDFYDAILPGAVSRPMQVP